MHAKFKANIMGFVVLIWGAGEATSVMFSFAVEQIKDHPWGVDYS